MSFEPFSFKIGAVAGAVTGFWISSELGNGQKSNKERFQFDYRRAMYQDPNDAARGGTISFMRDCEDLMGLMMH